MNEFEPINERDPARPGCAIGQAALQRLLDGDADWDSPDAAAHRAECVACREELLLAGAFNRPASIVVPSELTDRVVSTAVNSHRRRQAIRYFGAAACVFAATLLFLLAVQPAQNVQSIPGRVEVAKAPTVEPSVANPPPKPLGESVVEARDAIVSLTKRTASGTRDQSAMLMPNPKMPETPKANDGLDPLAEARAGAAKSVEPIRSSAVRALDFFVRAAEPKRN